MYHIQHVERDFIEILDGHHLEVCHGPGLFELLDVAVHANVYVFSVRKHAILKSRARMC